VAGRGRLGVAGAERLIAPYARLRGPGVLGQVKPDEG
jgi:hypothetical protein